MQTATTLSMRRGMNWQGTRAAMSTGARERHAAAIYAAARGITAANSRKLPAAS